FTAASARFTQKVQSSGKYITPSANGKRSRTIACPVIVVVEITKGRSGYRSFNFFAKGTLDNASPTDTACSQIAPGRSAGSFSSPGNDIPNRSPRFERYFFWLMPLIIQYGARVAAAIAINRL